MEMGFEPIRATEWAPIQSDLLGPEWLNDWFQKMNQIILLC